MIAKHAILLAALAVVSCFDTVAPASGQTYPTRPIAMVVPFAAGGATDTIGRIAADVMRVSLGQPVIIENVAGADGNIGVGRVVRAAPDGYTIVLGNWNTHVSNGALYRLQYGLVADFEPISLFAFAPYLIVAHKAVPANNLKTFIAWLNANPGKAAGTAGVGSAPHVGSVLFQNMTGTHYQIVPYRGGAPAMQDLVAGHIDWMMALPSDALPQVHAGNINAYAVTAKRRLGAAPEVPTVDEAGLPGLFLSNWFAVWAPKGTPKTIVAKLNGAVTAALADANVPARLADLGLEIFPREQQTPEALGSLQRAEIEKWWPIIKAAGIKAE
jgi:tripartite-type tricarboxylate transporter receptor subunit TctC